MPLDPERLRAFPIPSVRQRWTRRDSVLYALSVGLGADPLDARQIDFVEAASGPRTVPTMALVIAHPGFWLADPHSGADARFALHAEQDLELKGPLPPEGTFRSTARLSGLIDKGPGRAALVESETLIEDEEAGRVVAVARRLTYLKGQGGFGGAPDAPAPRVVPTRPPDIVIDLPTRPEQALLYALNGDDNPLHLRPQAAQVAGFARPLLHGLCTMGVVAHALLRGLADYDAARIARLRLRFTAPVYPGETLRTEIWRAATDTDGAFRARVLERDAVVVDGGAVALA